MNEPRASESNHWYTRDGVPRYTVVGANGRQRNTTLRDARKESLVPSVTTVMNIAAKPGLMIWMQRQVLLAALTLPRIDGESEDSFIDRVMQDAKESGRVAADVGTQIHAAVEGFYEGQVVTAYEPHVLGCVKAIREHFGEQPWIAERAFAHEIGYGGKCDMHTPATDSHDGIVVDIKTKDFTDPDKVQTYDEHLIQLAAYRVGLGIPMARCANVFVSRTTPGLSKVIEWSQKDLERGWKMFVSLLDFWKLKNQYD